MGIELEQIQRLLPFVVPLGLGLLLFLLSYAITHRVRNRICARRPQYQKEVFLGSKVVLGLASFIILMATLEAVNIPLGNVWTAISTVLALVAIGFFAVWSILSHMTAAVVLFFQRPFRRGDFLQFGDEDYAGKVLRTGLFFTEVEDPEGGRSAIPNNLLFQRRFRITSDGTKKS